MTMKRATIAPIVVGFTIVCFLAAKSSFINDRAVDAGTPDGVAGRKLWVDLLMLTDNSTSLENKIFSSFAEITNHPSDHDSLFPLQPTDYAGYLFAMFGLILAAGGGIGGGGILVPIYILVLEFLPKHAIPLSNVTVFGGAVANTILNVRKRHPQANRPLIDWELILVMEPSTLMGALVGANLNKVLPETVIAVMLVALLAFTAFGTLKKARKMHHKESEEIYRGGVIKVSDMEGEAIIGNHMNSTAIDRMMREDSEELNESLLPHDYLYDQEESLTFNRESSLENIQIDDGDDDTYTEFHNPVLQDQILDKERQPNRQNVALIITMFVVVLLINILKGGGGYNSPIGIECGSTAFWLSQVLLLFWIMFVSFIGRRRLIKETARKEEAGYAYLSGDIKWDSRSTIIYPLISTLAGFCAGMFGIGGGIVKGPLMLAMGIHPAVASATSACMILFTSFTATTTFAVYGLVVVDYAIACVIIGFFSTLVGQLVMTYLIAKFRRNSYIAFSIGIVVLLSAVLMTLQSVLHLMSDKEDDEFSGICDSHLNGPN